MTESETSDNGAVGSGVIDNSVTREPVQRGADQGPVYGAASHEHEPSRGAPQNGATDSGTSQEPVPSTAGQDPVHSGTGQDPVHQVAPQAPVHLETLIAHVGAVTDKVTGALTTPITMSTAYAHPALGQSTGYDYTRTANPTRDVLQEALARLEGGTAAFATSSGMAAVDLLVGTLAPGSRIVTTEDLYGGTYRLLSELRASGAYRVDFVHGEEGLLQALRSPADLALVETPTNPMMVEISIPAVAAACRRAGAILAVDNTFYTPVFQRPLSEGADVVLHSATKYLGGHNDVLAGALVTNREDLAATLGARLNTTGATLSPFDSWLLMRGIKTLALRMERHQDNARKVAAALHASEHVARVYYTGRGGMLSFDPASHVEMPAILSHVRLFTFAESLGGIESLITCPAVQTHMDVPPERRLAYGLGDDLLRLSVGLEHGDDLVADLLQALRAAAR